MSRDTSSDTPPPFDRPFEGEDVEQRVYAVVLQTRDPTPAGNIAERADCDAKTARKYLSWFADLGIVTEYDGRPSTYERNDAYFEWRRIDDLAANNAPEELQRRVSELTEKIENYRRRYDADSPDGVDALTSDRDTEDVYRDLSDWLTAIEERRLCERAHRQLRGNAGRTTGRP